MFLAIVRLHFCYHALICNLKGLVNLSSWSNKTWNINRLYLTSSLGLLGKVVALLYLKSFLFHC